MNNLPRCSGIYKIICIANSKIYIGSAINLKRRQNEHLIELRKNKHQNTPLQNAWNKYGETAFEFEIIELVMPFALLVREQYWLDTLKSYNRKNGFNINPTAESCLGRKCSLETRKKMSDSHKGRKLSPEQVEKSAAAHRGRKLSPEIIEKSAVARRGLKRSAEFSNQLAKRSSKSYLVISPSGAEIKIFNLSKFCRENNLSIQGMSRIATGERKQYKGWKCRYAS